ncbi:hypothetical protein BJY21_003783 [Kineosphaera limosa]|uniref:Uncharacterized protein n=1 Tax=Kineosphaera limosa NBRC 100340 TaxID=1184609 RepID=K6WD48_9MICO|nr:hypothetical protein [Kineosphaera limosa]NYE02599.1 hypothetical protein [Kineosphaera limosa]GAB97205.1 hypothetical protein KILIM_060_00030 [Kineosphaera limosa NBRC 100340]
MRWDRLFDDLQAGAEQEAGAARDVEVAERIRAERARVDLPSRLRAHRGSLRLLLRHARLLIGEVSEVGADWLQLEGDPRGANLVPLAAVVEIDGLGWAQAQPGPVLGRLTLGYPLRRLARDREVVEVLDALGRTLTGTVDAVGADAFELALHPRHVPRRRGNLAGRPTIPFAALVCLTAVGPE